jgi:hypothetical protein
MKNLLKNCCATYQARIFTALVLTGILSIGSGLTLIKSAIASAINVLPETTNEVTKQNYKQTRLPRSVANAVLRDLFQRQGRSPKKLEIIDYSQQTWRNGCLELPQADELCTQALVPGWQVAVSDGQQNWIYHTNQTGSAVRLSEQPSKIDQPQSSTLKPVPIPANQLPPPLQQNVVFRQISSGGLTGRTYETVLLNDGRLIRVRIGDANDSERSVRRISLKQVQQLQQLLKSSRFGEFRNLSYPAPNIAADHITHTLTSTEGTVQYNDISQNNLPQNLQAVVKGWNRISKSRI